MAPIRTFIAVQASQRVTNNVARVVSRLAVCGPGYRWVEPENLHVTLNFVGDVNDIEVPELCRLIKTTLAPFSGFELSLQGVSGFPQVAQPRVVWMGVDEGKAALDEMYRALAVELHHWGVNKDPKPYVPHMTLGRVARGQRWTPEMIELMNRLRNHDGGFCHVGEVIVFSSFLDRSGPTHTPMARIKLK